MNGLLTEREWRKQHIRRNRQPDWCGPQCVLRTKRKLAFQSDRMFHLFLLILSMVIAVLLPVFTPQSTDEFLQQEWEVDNAVHIQPRKVSSVSYVKPFFPEWTEHTYTFQQLARGKLLLLDQRHLPPKDLPPPNTFSIAAYGKGMIPVAELGIQSGRETIDALRSLFAALEQKGIRGLMVCKGTRSIAQQRKELLDELRTRMKYEIPKQALFETLQQTEWPYTGEMLQEYTVEIGYHARNAQDGLTPLEKTETGQALLQTAWRYGFVRTNPTNSSTQSFRLRYVGKAHATAMTFLNIGLEEYLQLLHEKETITIRIEDEPKYIICCQRAEGTHVKFTIPVHSSVEASLDNTGFAVIACTLHNGR